MSDEDRWLAERLAPAPASLRCRVESALAPDAAAGGDLADRLREVAERLMRQAGAGPPGRETAMTLLAADALITLSCEWSAERG